MIDYKELRYGNRFAFEYGTHKYPSIGEVLTIIPQRGCDSKYNCETYKLIGGLGFIEFEAMQPIPLTSEVLTERCGFLSDSTGKHWVGDFELYPIGKGFDYEGKVLVTSVHQLQNIYYFLNGSELPVNF